MRVQDKDFVDHYSAGLSESEAQSAKLGADATAPLSSWTPALQVKRGTAILSYISFT